MKYKTTKRYVMERAPYVISIGYCDAQDMLKNLDPEAYTCGIYGWNADVYRATPTAWIVTGYRPFGNVHPSRELVEEYEKAAREMIKAARAAGVDYYEIRRRAEAHIALFAAAAIEEHRNKGRK